MRSLWGLGAVALALAGDLTAVFWWPRLPVDAEGLLPRRPLWDLWLLELDLAHRKGPRVAFAAGAYALILAGLIMLALRARRLWRELRAAPPPPAQLAARLACAVLGMGLALHQARLLLRSGLDLLQNAFYPPEALSLAEPLWTKLLFAWALIWLAWAWAAALDWALGRSEEAFARARSFLLRLAALAVPAVALLAWSCLAYQAGKPDLARAAGLPAPPSGWRALVVLTADDGKPSQTPYTLPLGEPDQSDYDEARLAAAEKLARGGRSVYRRAALRFLYSGRTFLMDADGLDRALDLGVELGDPLARALLLERLACLLPGAANLGRLKLLADEERWRVGPRAAEKLARGFARFGDGEDAAYWLKRAAEGPGAPPAGLLSAAGGGPPRGRIRGSLAGLPGARAALYCRPGEFSPYALGPAQLVASAAVDKGGRFAFDGLPAGSYFLAVVRDGPRRPGKDLSLAGHRGDLVLSAGNPTASVSLRVR